MKSCSTRWPPTADFDLTVPPAGYVAMREGETTATFTLPEGGEFRVEVLGEDRSIDAAGGRWEDRFTGYQVHLYKIAPQPPG